MFYVQTIKQEEKLGEITPLDVQLKTTWDEATEAEKERGIDKAIEECRVVCNVIARNAGEELLQWFVQVSETDFASTELKMLM